MSRQVRVGILVFAGLALFLVALFAIASRSFLFSTTFPLESEFENVAGLQTGAPVQYQGANAGRVENVVFPTEPGGRFTVVMAIKDDVRPLINARTVAQIKSQSLVGGGMMVVLANPPIAELDTPPDELEPVEPGATIPGQEPFNIAETSDQLLATVDTFATVAVELQQIMQDVQEGKGSLGRFIYDDALYNRSVSTIAQFESSAAEAQDLMTTLSGSAERITASAEDATAGFQEVLDKVNRGEGTLGRLLNDETAYERLVSVTDSLLLATDRIEDILANTNNATQWAALGAYRFSENMEALKHNFLFKSYFEERGYMEKADFEIRESAIEATYEDLETWQRELNEREERLDELEARLQTLEAERNRASPPPPGATAPREASPPPDESTPLPKEEPSSEAGADAPAAETSPEGVSEAGSAENEAGDEAPGKDVSAAPSPVGLSSFDVAAPPLPLPEASRSTDQ